MPLTTHSDCRAKVCLFCFKKARNRDLRRFPAYLKIIQDHIIDHYDVEDVRFPCGLCDTHTRSINYLRKSLVNNGEETRKGNFDLEKLSLYLTSDSKVKRRAGSCECLICRVAKAGGVMENLVLKQFEEPLKENSSSESGSPERLCGKCLHLLRKGGRGHVCNQSSLLQNVKNILPEKLKDRVAADVIKDKLHATSSKNIEFATGAKTLKLEVNKAGDSSEVEISHEHINRMKKRMKLSQNQTLVLAEELRAVHKKKKVIPKNLKGFLKDRNAEFEDIFEFENVHGEDIIYCSNVPEHIVRVSRKRGHTEPKLIKVGVDSCQGTMKCAAFYLYESDSIFDKEDSETNRKRRKFSDGLDVTKLSNNNGVNRVQLLSLSTDTEENYMKLKFMLDKLNLEPGSFLLCADLKVINISLNLMSHSSRHPCPYCNWVKGTSTTEPDEARTFEGIRLNFETWERETGGDREKLKEYFNCQGPPLPIFPSVGLVSDFIPLSELHIMMGVTNKLVDCLIKVNVREYITLPSACPQSELGGSSKMSHTSGVTSQNIALYFQVWPAAENWPRQLHLLREKYHHGFEGNQCRALLKKVNVLEQLVVEDCQGSPNKDPSIHPARAYIDALKDFDGVVGGCFGKTLCSDYQERIDKFSKSYDECGASVTSKVHAVKAHLKAFLSKHEVGLAVFSEQAFEAIHSRFLDVWEKYKIKDQSNPNYIKALLRAVLEFNGINLV